MEILPALSEIGRIAADGKYRVLPVSCEILSDFITPIEALRILKNSSAHCYMLESVQADEKWGRYTFLGFEPKTEITCVNGVLQAGGLSCGNAENAVRILHPFAVDVSSGVETDGYKDKNKIAAFVAAVREADGKR